MVERAEFISIEHEFKKVFLAIWHGIISLGLGTFGENFVNSFLRVAESRRPPHVKSPFDLDRFAGITSPAFDVEQLCELFGLRRVWHVISPLSFLVICVKVGLIFHNCTSRMP